MFRFSPFGTGYAMKKADCFVCRKQGLSRNEIGLNQKLMGRSIKQFYCINCLADYLEVTTEELLARIEDSKAEGCPLFE